MTLTLISTKYPSPSWISAILMCLNPRKGKEVLGYENELKERERKLQSAEEILQRKEHAVDMRLARLEDKFKAATIDAQKWKQLHDEQVEIIKKLEMQRDDVLRNEAIHEHTVGELKKKIGELEAKLKDQGNSAGMDSVVQSVSPHNEDKGKSVVVFPEPTFSLGLTQMEIDEDASKAIEAADSKEHEKPVTIPQVKKQTQSKQDVMSPSPSSGLGKLGKNLRKYNAFKDLSDENKGTIEFLAGKDELKG